MGPDNVIVIVIVIVFASVSVHCHGLRRVNAYRTNSQSNAKQHNNAASTKT